MPQYVRRDFQDAVQVAQITTAASASTEAGSAVSGMGGYNAIAVLTDVSYATGAVATLNVLVDTQFGASGTWNNVANSTIYTAAGQYQMVLVQPSTNSESTLGGDAGAGTKRDAAWGDTIRIRQVVSGTATTQVSATVYITRIG